VKLIYSEQSVKDLRRLRDFIAEHNPDAAQRIAQQLLDRLDNLVLFPRMGVSVLSAPDPESVRDIILDDYVIRYSCHPETLVVLRMWHHLEMRPGSINLSE